MKFIMLTALIFTSFSAYSASPFTSSQEKTVLKAIDDVCGDTWCEGDYGFRFNSFTCDKTTSTCELNFQFIKREENDEREVLSAEQVCRFKNIKTFSQLMENKWGLSDKFYDSVSDCISARESKVEF